MKINKFMVVGLCACLVLLTGCGKIAKLANGQEVVASVNKTNITADDLYNKIKEKYARDALIEMIDRSILEKKYKTDDLKEQVNEQIESIKTQTGEDNFLSSIKSQWGFSSEAELYSYIELNLMRNTAIEDYLKEHVTDDEIQSYYDIKTVGDIKASHILIKPATTDSMTDDEKTAKEAEALKEAKSIIKKLNNGEDFAELAKKYSDDEGSASKGGNLGWFNKGVMDDAFETAAFSLEKGKYTTEPVKSSYGYHIILKTGEKSKPKLEEAKDSIIESIVSDKMENSTTIYYTTIEAIRKENKLVINDSELKAQYDAYMTEIETSSSTTSN